MIKKVGLLELKRLKDLALARVVNDKEIPLFENLFNVFELSYPSLLLKYGCCKFYVLEVKGDVKGFVTIFRNSVLNVITFEGKKGYGSRLLAYAEQQIAKKGYGNVILFSGSSTNFFLKNGYDVVYSSRLFGTKLSKEVRNNDIC